MGGSLLPEKRVRACCAVMMTGLILGVVACVHLSSATAECEKRTPDSEREQCFKEARPERSEPGYIKR